MAGKWEYFVSTIIVEEKERSKTADKLEAMMNNKGVAGWELINIVPIGSSAVYAVYKRPLN